MTEPGCGNDSSRGRMRTILLLASGHVLPLPSFASRRMPPSPRGGRKGTNPQRPCRGRRPDAPAAHGNGLLPPSANPHMPGRERRPRRSAQQHSPEALRWANPHSPCRARRPRRAAQQHSRFPLTLGEFASASRREGACPFRQGMSRHPPTLGEFARGSRICPGFPVSARVLRGKGKPFPYNETAADSPPVATCLWCCCGTGHGLGDVPYKAPLSMRRWGR